MKLFAAFRKDLKLLLRDRGQMVSLFLLPLVFIFPICLAFPADGYNRSQNFKPRLPVVTYDIANGAPAAHAQSLLDGLAETYNLEMNFGAKDLASLNLSGEAQCADRGPACDEAVARALVSQDQRTAGLVIPQGLSAAIDAGQRISLTLLYNPVSSPVDRQMVEGVIKGSALKLSIENQVFGGMNQFADMIGLAPQEIRDVIDRQTAANATTVTGATSIFTSTNPAIAVVAVRPAIFTLAKIPDTQQQTIPGYTVLFAYFLIATVASSFQLDRNSGVLRRLLFTPLPRTLILGGKTLAALLIGVLQIVTMFAVGHFAFGMGLGEAPVALAVFIVVVALSAVCIGLAAAAYRIERGISLPLIVAALLAGCAFPADWLPPFIRAASVVLPQTWAMQGFQDLLTRGQGFAQVLPEMGVLLLFSAVFFVVAIRRFEFE